MRSISRHLLTAGIVVLLAAGCGGASGPAGTSVPTDMQPVTSYAPAAAGPVAPTTATTQSLHDRIMAEQAQSGAVPTTTTSGAAPSVAAEGSTTTSSLEAASDPLVLADGTVRVVCRLDSSQDVALYSLVPESLNVGAIARSVLEEPITTDRGEGFVSYHDRRSDLILPGAERHTRTLPPRARSAADRDEP